MLMVEKGRRATPRKRTAALFAAHGPFFFSNVAPDLHGFRSTTSPSCIGGIPTPLLGPT